MDPATEPRASVAFGRFRVLPHRRELLADGRPVRLGGRAFDVLMALIEARGVVVSKDTLMARVWPDRVVGENNLQAQVVALRGAFGADRELIRTVVGRGYQFTGEIRVVPASPGEPVGAVATQPASVLPPTNTPKPVSELIGRDADVEEVVRLAGAHRLVTLTGAGGIGKTTLALAVARELRPQFADGMWLAELSALADPGLVPATVAAAVGLELGGGEASAQGVAQALSDRRLLLVLDTCEHVITAATAMAEALLGAGSALHIIATSRELLRAGGEWIYSVQPLAVPAANFAAEDDPLRYGAVRLFMERARAAQPHFAPERRLIAMIAAICRRLDGIPLAIELAAARAAALSIEALAARLDDRFRLLTGGRRMAPPRHQALRATLDWSYGLLVEPERLLLHRLAIFAGPFSLEAAGEVAASPELVASHVIEGLSSLVAKSLVVANTGEAIAHYRLLDTTRAYALEKLGESGEREPIARRHAEYHQDLFERAEAEWKARPTAEWLGEYGGRIDNLRAALDWAFSSGGDASLGVSLTAAAVPLWMHLSLVDECCGRVERALTALEIETNRHPHQEMRLHAAMGEALTYMRGATPEYEAAWTKALEMAESLDDAEYQIRALWFLWALHITRGRHRTALELAQRFCAVAENRPDRQKRVFGLIMIGATHHFLGDLPSARRYLEEGLAQSGFADHRTAVYWLETVFPVAARAFLAQVLWFEGFSDQAVRAAEISVAEAGATGHALSLPLALGMGACPIALLVGDLVAAEDYVGMLLDKSTRYAPTIWRAYGRCYRGALVIKRGEIGSGLGLLRTGFAELGEAQSAVLRLAKPLVAETLGHAGQIADGLTVIEEAIDHAERTEERWLIAELLRVKGELLLSQGADGAATAAADHFRQALDWARRQGALAWELRVATSLARLLRDQDRSADLWRYSNRATTGLQKGSRQPI